MQALQTATPNTAWPQTAISHSAAAQAISLRARGGQRFVLRVAQRLLGASLLLAAFGFWLLPAGTGTTTEVLCKLMVTLILAFTGAALWQEGSPAPSPDIEIDIRKRVVRLVRHQGGVKTLVACRHFDALAAVETCGRDVQIWDVDRALLAEFSMPNRAAAEALAHVLAPSSDMSRIVD